MVWNGSQWNQCWGPGSFKLGTGAFCLKVVKYFEILASFCSLSISFFLLVCPCPVSLAFPHSWPQGRCDSWEQSKEESIQGFWIIRAKALRDLGRTAAPKQWMCKDICWGGASSWKLGCREEGSRRRCEKFSAGGFYTLVLCSCQIEVPTGRGWGAGMNHS